MSMFRFVVILPIVAVLLMFPNYNGVALAEVSEFWSEFEKVVYRPNNKEIVKIDDASIMLNVVGLNKRQLVNNVIAQILPVLKTDSIQIKQNDRFIIIFSNDFSKTVRFQYGGHFLAKFPYVYTRRDMKKIMANAFRKGCFFSSSVVSIDGEEKEIYSTLLVNSELSKDSQQKCIFYYFLKSGGLSNISFEQVDDFLVKGKDGFLLDNFAVQALSLIERSGITERKSKSKMKKFVEANYPVSRELNK